MKILVVGSGGRESALVWKLAQSPKVETIYVAPGNGGTAEENKCVNVPIKADDINDIVQFAKHEADFVVIGPEDPLSKGVVDALEEAGIKVFGPRKAAALIEASKAFAKELMVASGVPTAKYAEFTDYDEALRYIKSEGAPIVVKADGLAAGKGVTVAHSVSEAKAALKEIFLDNVFGFDDIKVVIEEFLDGEEVSYLVVTDGETIVPMVSSQDHKAVFDGDKGPNTGGMGAYSPAPLFSESDYDKLTALVSRPIIEEFKKRGIKFKGVLYAGLMVSKDGVGKDFEGVKVLEYNARFGDPETQVIMPRMESDLLELLIAAADEKLHEYSIKWNSKPSVSVVMASGGYPGDYKKGMVIKGLDTIDDDVKVFHAGTARDEKGNIVTTGGRVLNVTAVGDNLQDALDKAYSAVKKISFDGAQYRTDIGAKALKRGM